jgi:error-prone DNA polymerase
VWERFHAIVQNAQAWIAHGRLESKDSVIHVIVGRVEDLAARLPDSGFKSRDFR